MSHDGGNTLKYQVNHEGLRTLPRNPVECGFRTHLALEMDCPEPRAVEPPEIGQAVAVPEVGGLHHHYERQAA